MSEYRLSEAEQADELRLIAEAKAAAARDNNQQADDYVLLTVLFASVLFFAGMSTKMRSEQTQIAIFAIGLVILVGALIVLSSQPVESTCRVWRPQLSLTNAAAAWALTSPKSEDHDLAKVSHPFET